MKKSSHGKINKAVVALLFSVLSFSFLVGVNEKRELQVGDIAPDGGTILEVDVDEAKKIKATPFVTPTDTAYNTQKNYSMNNVGNIEAVWDTYTGEDVLIAVIDSGFVYEHEDFKDQSNNTIFDVQSAYIYTDWEAYQVKAVLASSDNWECMKHEYDTYDNEWDTRGSNVAGSAAAALNGVGTVGIAPKAHILALKIDFYLSSVAGAIQYAADCGADVINLSLGVYDSTEPGPDGGYDGVATALTDSINYARNTKGVIVVAAAGNENTSAKSYPACNAGVIGVGALYKNSSTTRASFSNFNKTTDTVAGDHNVDVMAPGYVWAPGLEGTQLGNSSTNYPDPGYGATQGTSFASPITAGAAALWKDKFPSGTPDEFEADLYEAAVDMGNFQYYGNGRLDVYKLLTLHDDGPIINPTSLNLTTESSPITVTATSTVSTIKSWSCSNIGVFTFSNVTGLDTANSSAKVNVVGVGNATLTVTDHLNQTKSIPVVVSEPATSHTITFKTNATDGSNDLTDATFKAEILTGADLVDSFTNISKAYSGINGIKMSSSKANGYFTLNLKQAYSITKVIINACQFGSDATTLAVNGGTPQTISGSSLADYTFNLDGSAISSLTINAVNRNYIRGITFEFAGGGAEPPTPTVTSVTVTPSTLSLDLYNNPTSTLSATVNGTNSPSQEVSWSSSDNTIATVSSSGVVTALKTGSVTITATSTFDTTKSGTCSVSITDSTPPLPPDPAEFLTQDSPYLNGIPYKMYFVNTGDTNPGTYYFAGSMSGYYGTTTTTLANAVDVYFEQNGLGQNIYFEDGGVKNYFYVQLSGSYKNFKYGTATPDTAWVYSNERDVICYPISGSNYTFGTWGNYTTFGAFLFESKTLTNYHVKFVTTNANSATTYAKAFSKYITCDGTGATAPTFTSPKSWHVLDLAYQSLNSSAKTTLQNAAANPAGTEVEQAMARYNFIVGKYGVATYSDFIGRNPSGAFNFQMEIINDKYLMGILLFGMVVALAFIGVKTSKHKRREIE